MQQHLALHVKEVDGAARHRAPFQGSERRDTSIYCKSNVCLVTGLVFFLPSVALIVPFASPVPTNKSSGMSTKTNHPKFDKVKKALR